MKQNEARFNYELNDMVVDERRKELQAEHISKFGIKYFNFKEDNQKRKWLTKCQVLPY